MGEAAWGRGDAEEQSVVGEVGTEGPARPTRGGGSGEQRAELVPATAVSLGLGLDFFFSLPNLADTADTKDSADTTKIKLNSRYNWSSGYM